MARKKADSESIGIEPNLKGLNRSFWTKGGEKVQNGQTTYLPAEEAQHYIDNGMARRVSDGPPDGDEAAELDPPEDSGDAATSD